MRTTLLLFFLIPFLVRAQTNVFPSNGNVGVGTTTPQAPVHVYSTAPYPRYYIQTTATNGAPGFTILENNGNEAWSYHYDIAGGFSGFFRGGLGNAMVITNSGKVGIGTTSPGQKLHVAGTIKAGSYTFITEPNNGLASVFANNLFAGVSNNTLVRQQNSDPGNYLNISYNRGIIFGTGVTSPAGTEVPDNINERMRIDLDGNVGIGTTTPQALLDVSGQLRLGKVGLAGKIDFARSGDGSYQSYLGWSSNETFRQYFSGGGSSYRIATWMNDQETDLVTILNNGNVGIGTTDTKGYKLAVNGDAIFTKVKVKQYTSWPDYVFHSGYQLPSLQEVEQFIQQHKHLPNIPSREEVEKSDGIDIGEMNQKLLEKVEELTLYIIEQQKQIEALKKAKDLDNQKDIQESLLKKVEALEQQVKARKSK